MTKIYNFTKLMCIIIAMYSVKVYGQCVYASPYGSGTINSSSPGTSLTISTCNFGGEYASVTFSVTGAFTFSTSVATDYITITDGSNSVVAFGSNPLAATIPSVGLYRIHYAASGPPTCGTQSTCRSTSIFVPLSPCVGTPTAGIVPASFSICANSQAVITATGSTAATGITYQWMQSASAGGPWTNVTTGFGVNTPSLITSSLTSLTFYQMVVTCTTSAQSVTTSVVSVNPNNPAIACYCNQNIGGGGCFGNNISNVSILSTPLNNSSGCVTNASGDSYSQYTPSTTTTATLNAGASYSMSVNTTANNIIGFWIDYDQSGTFDPIEYNQVANPSSANIASVLIFNVPSTAIGGQTGMRVRTHDEFASITSADACSFFYEGETEDYIITINPATPCSGAPSPGTISSTSTLVCAGTVVNLNLSGFTVASGLTFQWQSSPNNTAWTSISGATTTALSETITALTYYQVIVACGSNTAVTASIQFSLLPATACYCNQNLGGSFCSGDNITNVSILGTSFNSNSTCTTTVNNGTYSQFPPSASTTATLNAGVSYSLSVTTTANNIESVWIDYNQNGIFDASEHTQICLTSVSNTATTILFSVPVNALIGQTGMRVRSRATGNPNGAIDACTSFGSGEAEDYIVTIAPAVACSGAPGANSAITTLTSVCPNGSATLSLANSYTVGGLTYQWSTATNSVGPYSAVSGATNTSYTATNITVATWYQCIITCTNGPVSTTATPINLVVSGNPCQCSSYCTSNATLTNDEDIFNVSIGTLNNTSTCGQTGGPTSTVSLYSNYAGLIASPNLSAGLNYTLSVTAGECNGTSYSGIVSAYMDFNQNGLFTDPGELVYTSPYGLFVVSGSTFSSVVTIPANATLGSTRMRVMVEESSTTAGPCGTFFFGETEDYCITITAATPCSGAPVANSVVTTFTNVCPNGSTNLSLANSYTVGGLAYQWSTATNSVGPYSAITGATNTAYTATNISAATWYQCVITCTNGPASTTATPVQVIVGGNPCQCASYCASSAGFTQDDEIFNVSIGTLNNTSSCSQTGGTGSILNLYSNYAGILPSPSLQAGTNQTLSVNVGQCGSNPYSGGVTVYIDFNQNGSFTDPGEQVYASPNTLFAVTGTTVGSVIQIPASATPGTTRMRVIAAESSIGTAPCAAYNWGETEDYCVTIVPAIPCSGTPASNSVVASSSLVCIGGASNLSLVTTYTNGGLAFQWSTATNSVGPYVAVSGGTTNVFPATNITAPTWYQCVITCTNGPASTTASAVQVGILGAPVYASVPLLENFDNVWQDRCDLHNVPVAANWDSNPTTGDNSWRRQDDGSSANWTSTIFTVTPLTGAGCANFHSWDTPSQGDLNLYVNLNSTTTYTLSFWYQNAFGSDFLDVSLSNNGGSTYTNQANYTNDAVWTKKTILLSSVNSPSCVIKFSTQGDFSDDLAIDSLQIQGNCVVPNVSVTASQTTICSGSSVNLTASGANTYTWSNNATTNAITVTPTVSTSYTVTGANSISCPATKTINITVKPSPILVVSPSATICPGGTATLSASGANSYSWTPGNYTTAAVSATAAISTVYNVVGTNTAGCATNSNVTVFVVVCTGLAKNTVVDNKTFIYPNPNNGNITVVIDNNSGNYAFEVMDLAGRIVYKTTLNRPETSLNIKELANGMYTYKITSLTSKIAIKEGKLIKE